MFIEDYSKLPKLLTITQAAKLIGVSRNYIYTRIDELPTIELAGKTWILRDPLLKKLKTVGEEDADISEQYPQLVKGINQIIDLLKSIDKTLNNKYRY